MNLSRMLFESREVISMYADIVEVRTGRRDARLERLRQEIDQYRAAQGWPADGFSDEDILAP